MFARSHHHGGASMTAANSERTAKRLPPKGKPFAKGQSGNPSGRPKIIAEIRDLARTHTDLAINTLAEICAVADKDSARVSAAVALLDRGWGKPIQAISGPDGGAIPLEIAGLDDDALEARAKAIIAKRKSK